MPAPAYRYLHLDVFTDHVFGGNQLAVFSFVDRGREPRGREPELPTPDLMQAITREMAYSECAFVFAPERLDTEVRVRIFTPGKELPMAGHPTIGTAFALAHDGFIPPGRPSIVFGLGVGPVPVSLRWDKGGLAFAEMTQLRPTFGPPVVALDAVAEALGVAEADIRSTGVPVQEVSCGIPFLMVPLASRAAVDAAALDRAGLTRLCSRLGSRPAIEVFLFSTERAGEGATAYSRMFAPGLGIAEDPATGAASGPLGCYLVRHRLVAPADAEHIISLQGVKMGRPSQIHIAIEGTAEEITRVRVGGAAVIVGEGALTCAPGPRAT
jgi:trans-2,3-dihydro-3-hydroxyanthranilate isomerase